MTVMSCHAPLSLVLNSRFTVRPAPSVTMTGSEPSWKPADPNNTIYPFDASQNYNPAPRLSKIEVAVLWINSADDFINPPGPGDAQALGAQMPNARFVLVPATAETRGHGTQTFPVIWPCHLAPSSGRMTLSPSLQTIGKV